MNDSARKAGTGRGREKGVSELKYISIFQNIKKQFQDVFQRSVIIIYFNSFKAINQQMSYARLELCCKERKVTVNFNHDLRVIPRQYC